MPNISLFDNIFDKSTNILSEIALSEAANNLFDAQSLESDRLI